MIENIFGWPRFILSKCEYAFDSVLSKLETKVDNETGRTWMIFLLIIEFMACILCTVVTICQTIAGVGRFDVNIFVAIWCMVMTVMLYNIILTFCESEALRKEGDWREGARWREKESCNK